MRSIKWNSLVAGVESVIAVCKEVAVKAIANLATLMSKNYWKPQFLILKKREPIFSMGTPNQRGHKQK